MRKANNAHTYIVVVVVVVVGSRGSLEKASVPTDMGPPHHHSMLLLLDVPLSVWKRFHGHYGDF